MPKRKHGRNLSQEAIRITIRIWSLILRGRFYSALRLVKTSMNTLLIKINNLDFSPDPKFGTSCRGYWNSIESDLERILEKQNITDGDSILDIGCGKGGALLTLTKFPFKSIDGIEINEAYIPIARANLKRMGKIACNVFHADAIDFKEFHKYNHFYFFDPFTCEVMQKVIENLIKSVEEFPRIIKLIYNQPTCHDTIIHSKRFRFIETFEHHEEGISDLKFNVYEFCDKECAQGAPVYRKLWD